MNEKEEERVDKYKQVEKRLNVWDRSHRRATLSEIEAAIDSELTQLRREIIEEMVQEREAEREGVAEACPNCGQVMAGNGKKKRKLKSKGGEEIRLEREQLRCTGCGMTLFPPG